MIPALIATIAPLLDKFIPNVEERARLTHEIATLAERQAHEIALAQIEVNKEEARSSDRFKSSWRPLIGYICAAAFGWHYVGQPIALFLIALNGLDLPALPVFDMETLLTVLGGLLGLGTLRTFEKIRKAD